MPEQNSTTITGLRAVGFSGSAAVLGVIVWIMAGTPESPARNWLITMWIVLAAAVMGCGVARRVPKYLAVVLLCLAVAVPVASWMTGMREGLLLSPYAPLVLAYLGLGFTGSRRRQEARSPSA